MKLASLTALAAMSWCQPAAGPGSNQPEAATPAVVAATPVDDRGEPLQATIPLYRDEAAPLSSLHGKVVVLELFALSEADWPEQHAPWRALKAAHPDGVEVVTVATTPDPSDADSVAAWDADPPLHWAGWDPQGALLLRLGATGLPTVWVLDRQGRVVASGAERVALAEIATSLVSER